MTINLVDDGIVLRNVRHSASAVAATVGNNTGYGRRIGMTIICPKCELRMPPEKIGVRVEAMAAFGSYQIHAGDLFRCPGCGLEIVAGISPTPIAEHYQSSYAEQLAMYPPVARFWWTESEKRLFEAGSRDA